jgi:serine protease Do
MFGENDRRSNISRDRLLEGEVRPFLGVTSEESDKGAKITAVSKGSAAERAGLKEGDIITRIEKKKITDPEVLMDVVAEYKPKQEVKISYLRDGKTKDAKAVLGERKDALVRSYSYNGDRGPSQGGTFLKDFKFTMPAMPDMPRGDFFMFNRKKLGVRIEDAENHDGAMITKIDSGSVAEKAGLKINDVLTEINGKKVTSVSEARENISHVEKNDFIVKAKRNGTEMTFNIRMPKKIESADL